MQCDVAPISSCDIPPHGGCDPLTTCVVNSVEFFGSIIKQVECGDCPPGYKAEMKMDNGLNRCVDINECVERPNGGCDPHTHCTNTDGGYICSQCPPDFKGTDGLNDPYSEHGCCSPETTYVAIGEHISECRGCSAGQTYDRTVGPLGQCT